jgi:glyoxylate/hydroxypyruvate reductase A
MDDPARFQTNSKLLLVRSGGEAAVPEWQALFREVVPGLEVRWWGDPTVDASAVTYVLVWEPDPGQLARYPNLRVIFSSAAGVDHIVRDPALPKAVPIVRMAAEETAQTVSEYVCFGALALLRDLPRMVAAQQARQWDCFEPTRTALTTRVGIMGMGNIGRVAARMLNGLGFPVSGWARSPKSLDGIRVYAGTDELDAFLAQTDILIGLLPDTAETRGLICARTLACLPRGAGLVNAGRGSLVVMDDLIAALDSGHLDAAMLDVFEPEPLPPEDRAWSHPRITVTSHLAGSATRRSRVGYVAAAMAAFERGEPLANIYEPVRGY